MDGLLFDTETLYREAIFRAAAEGGTISLLMSSIERLV
jgi:hypothetical protein